MGYTGPVQLFTEPSDVWEAYIESFGDHHMWFLSEGKEVGGRVSSSQGLWKNHWLQRRPGDVGVQVFWIPGHRCGGLCHTYI